MLNCYNSHMLRDFVAKTCGAMSWKNHVGIFFVSLVLATLLYLYFGGPSLDFVWENHISFRSPIFLFTGILTFFTIGKWLYNIGFYKGLYRWSGDHRLFVLLKAVVWLIATTIVAGVIYACIWVVNVMMNLFYNFIALVPVVTPIVFMAVLFWLGAVMVVYYSKNTKRKVN